MDNIVYSSEAGFCTACRKAPCVCKVAGKRRQPEPVRLRFARGAKGSGVTFIERLNMHPSLKEKLLSRFKKRFGCGGTIKDGVLEIQGDRRDVLQNEFEKDGYRIKRIGG